MGLQVSSSTVLFILFLFFALNYGASLVLQRLEDRRFSAPDPLAGSDPGRAPQREGFTDVKEQQEKENELMQAMDNLFKYDGNIK